MGHWGMSIPVCSTSALRNGVDEGQEPTQMPQLAHRSLRTCASSMPTRPLGCGTMVMAA